MDREEIEKEFDNRFIVGVGLGVKSEIKSFFFDKILPEVLKEILPEKRTWCDWSDNYNDAIETIEEKAKEKYNITL